MLNKKNLLAGMLAISAAVIISSCGSSTGSNTGNGGPDVSPEQYTDLNPPATDAANTEITGTTAAGEGTIIESVVDRKLEESLDVATGDAGIQAAEEVLDGVKEVTEATSTSATSTDTGTSDNTTATSSDTTASTTETSASGDNAATVTETTTSTTTTEETAASSTGTTNSGETTAVSSDTTSSGDTTGTVAAQEPVVSGDAINALEDDEAVAQTNLDYSIDSSQGRWYEETKTDLFSAAEAKSVSAEIESLRNEIKSVLTSYKDGKTDKETGKVKIKQLREKIAVLRAKIGNGGRIQTGIYTNWAKENLYLNIKNGEPGWYRIIIIAKNRGKLADDYDRFTFSINNDSNDNLAGISVKASDKVYYSGSADIKLETPANTKLDIVWTNDAYMKDKYDANVSIKKIVLKKIKEPKTKTVNKKRFSGDKFSFMDGRWFFENKAAYTFWANQVIGYTFKNLEEGIYEVTVTAKNYGSLPLEKKYKEFNIEVDSDYDSAVMNIKADDKNWNKEKVTMNFAEGDTTLYLTWTNDSYKENAYDANIMIKSISIKKVQKSSLTAFLLRTKPGNKVFILGAFLMLSGLIFGIYLKNKTSKDA